ncbi:MAG: carboxyl transferase domain-containing protein [Myxococcota bacterium]
MLIANRGEIAVRVIRTARDLGLRSAAVYSTDDARALHVRLADSAHALSGEGPSAYLDISALLSAARALGADAVHPGYGFLSERADFARACLQHGLRFIGPSVETMEHLGDKARARALAEQVGLRCVEGSQLLPDAEAARDFFLTLEGDAMALKSTAGGGGRGIAVVKRADEIEDAFTRCRAEAERSFGDGGIIAERWLGSVRHVEVQLVGDGLEVIALGTRDCSLQRRRQKIAELAPAPGLSAERLEAMEAGAVALGRAAGLTGLATVELLVSDEAWYFLECNPRLQVEHTVTEAITGLDLVALQLRLAEGKRIRDLGIERLREQGCALQLRVNTTGGGALSSLRLPGGPGIRVDTAAVEGEAPNPRFDPLLLKLVVSSDGDRGKLLQRARRALDELEIVGPTTDRGRLLTLLEADALTDWSVDTGFVEARFPLEGDGPGEAAEAVLHDGVVEIRSPLRAEVVRLPDKDEVPAGGELVILEALKMHHVVTAPGPGRVLRVEVSVGDVVSPGDLLVVLDASASEGPYEERKAAVDLNYVRPDLGRLREKLALTEDTARPDAIRKRHARGGRSARENIADLCDPGTFLEYGQLTVAAQRRVRPLEELERATPADGLVAGFGVVNGERFGEEGGRCAVLAYDYTVLAGTQGMMNHKKTDRVLDLASSWEVPVVFFCEGGGGRPSDTDQTEIVASTLDVATFATFAGGGGRSPRLSIAHGPCFAGNAVLFGCADFTIATRASFVGMAGPAMVEAGGLGAWKVQDLGPIDVQSANGVVDVVAEDEADAARLARTLLSFFQGSIEPGPAPDARLLRHVVPEDRKRTYSMRDIIRGWVDIDSFVELRSGSAPGLIVGLGRLEGAPVAVYANDPSYLGGALDAAASDLAAWFFGLAERFRVPLVGLCDTPGFMVGPEAEREGTVRAASRMMLAAGRLTVPLVMVGIRKGYGLGAQAMAGGSFWRPALTVAWPSGEFGPMGLEGAVQLALRKELEAANDEAARKALFDAAVAKLYEAGEAVSTARVLEIDAVIDPAETRPTLLRALRAFKGP